MFVDMAKAEQLASMIKHEREPVGVCIEYGFAGLSTMLLAASTQRAVAREVRQSVACVTDDLICLLTLSARLQWQLELREKGELGEGLWVYFTRLDIEYFFIVLRSAMDHVAETLKSVSLKPGQVPDGFDQLRSFAGTSRGPTVLGSDICELLAGTDWFVEARSIRDDIAHFGGWALAFISGEAIPFQVYQGVRQRSLISDVMFNENVADFRKLAALLLAYLFAVLEEVDQVVRRRLELPPKGPRAFTGGPGTLALAHWLAVLLGREELTLPQAPD